jgi:RNA polymerase sigma-70 factor (ECF subfamily)
MPKKSPGGTLKPVNILQQLNRLLQVREAEPPLVEPGAFDSLYSQTYLSVFRYVYGLTGGPATEVEDLTAEAYLRAWKSRESYRGSPDLAIGWVMKIARNLVIDSYRRGKSSTLLENGFFEEENLLAAADQRPEAQVIAAEQQQWVLDQLQQLPAGQREILVLRYLLNWKVQQISQYLEIPENTISVTIRRSLEKIRASWPVEKESIK